MHDGARFLSGRVIVPTPPPPVRKEHVRKELSALARKLEVFPGEVTNPDLGVRKEHLAGLTEIGSVPR